VEIGREGEEMMTDRLALAKCAACGETRDLADMLMCWERARPEVRWYLCRTGSLSGTCFARRSGYAVDVGIALATDGVPGDAARLDLVR
jgi:hypothetical protein